jgi:hypothetical protein
MWAEIYMNILFRKELQTHSICVRALFYLESVRAVTVLYSKAYLSLDILKGKKVKKVVPVIN